LTSPEKKTKRAREASAAERAAFAAKQATLPVARLWFIDEFGAHLALSRTYARAPRGCRAQVVERFDTGGNVSVISALTWAGVRAPLMIKGAINGEVLEGYVQHFLVPELRPGDIVIWDNVPTHKNERVRSLIAATGARLEPLPAYSPDLNAIEEGISKVKAELRRAKADTLRKLGNALKRAFGKITRQDIRGWFKHAGYAVP
jgi:transposase